MKTLRLNHCYHMNTNKTLKNCSVLYEYVGVHTNGNFMFYNYSKKTREYFSEKELSRLNVKRAGKASTIEKLSSYFDKNKKNLK